MKLRIPWKIRTFRRRLFSVYSTLNIVVLLAVAILFYAFYLGSSMDQIAAEQNQLSTAIVNASDTEVGAMDTVSMNIFFSKVVETHLQRYMKLSPDEDFEERMQTQQSLIDIIWAIIGPFQYVSQVNIYDLEGHMIGAGLFNQQVNVEFVDKSWYDRTRDLDGAKNLTGPRQLQYIDSSNYHFLDRSFLSLSRFYKDGTLEAKGIIEVLQDANTVFSFLKSMHRYHPEAGFYVLDMDGNYVYPFVDSIDTAGRHYYNLIQQQNWKPQSTHRIAHPVDERLQIITHASSDYTGWTVIVAYPTSIIYQPLVRFTWIFLGLGLCVFLLTLMISFVVSGSIIRPLSDLREAIAGTNITTLQEFKNGKYSSPIVLRTSLDEFQTIHSAFRAMQQELNQAVSQLLNAKTQEAHAKLLAIQSQMDPHFLYNNLATIQAMADEGMHDKIGQFTKDMSRMLRYITEKAEYGVPLIKEIRYVETYLRLMKIRLQSNLTYTVNIPDHLHELCVPKLLIQPLVENSIKHGFTGTPPWHLNLHGWVEPDSKNNGITSKWFLSVTDSGCGFSSQILADFANNLDERVDPYDSIQLSLDGMGLLNTYMRLRLLYRDEAIFQLKNNSSGGASITIGGPILAQEDGRDNGIL